MTKLYILSFFVAAILLSSCNDWLDLEPENDQISENYWQTKEEVEAVLGAGYVTLRNQVETLMAWGEARGGSLAVFNASTDVRNLNRWNITPQNNLCKWGDMYEIINYANSVLQYGPDVVKKDDSFNESVMRSYLSEAYFLRALAYFYLVRNFREVPLVTGAYVNDDQEFEIPKASESVIFDQIISDLKEALPASKVVFPEQWETKGRATRWAIKALLADVYLWTGDYELAIVELNDIINSGRVGLIQGLGTNNENRWFLIFSEGTDNLNISNEIIFELQFEEDLNQTNGLRNMFGAISPDYRLGENLFLQFQEEPDDIRGENATYESETSSRIWKYFGLAADGVATRENSDQNFILYRMADVYLMKAEALAMTGNYQAAIGEVNRVRQRAGIDNDLATPDNELETLKMIIDERAKEFVGEAKRWYDLLRIGRRNNYEYKDYLTQEVLIGAPTNSSALIRSKLYDVDSYYLPIHFDELQVNPKLVQNPYYETLN